MRRRNKTITLVVCGIHLLWIQLLTSRYILNTVQYHSSNCQKEEGTCLYPISSEKLLGHYKRTSRRLCNVVGSRKSFGGQIKVESITHAHEHMHMYMHAHIHAYIHAYLPAPLPECERGLHHGAESRLHWHPFVFRDKTMPSRTHNSDELTEK